MKTRILKVTQTTGKSPFYVPQFSLADGLWQEFFGYNPHSPYLHPICLDTLAEARAYLSKPSIWWEGTCAPGVHAEVVP